MARLAREDKRHLSLVDCTSFEFMAGRGIGEALTVDRHFRQEGFELIPRLE
jgi:predicted nucleic acid-binding protein